MKLLYYEMMDDKSKEYLLYLIEQILPQFTNSELKFFLEDVTSEPTKTKKGSKPKSNKGSKPKSNKGSKPKSNKGYVQIGSDVSKVADLSKLAIEKLKSLFQIFISREKNDKLAIKWRLYQYLKYMSNLNVKSIKINQDPDPNQLIDLIIETADKEVILVLCHDVLELNSYEKAINQITEFAKKQNSIPDRIIFATGKSFRNIPIDTPIKIINSEILPELWIEWTEENRFFNREDLLIVNDSELKIAGFNFTSTDDLLNYVFKHSNGGQISIFKQLDFFTEISDDEPEVELIWKGIMIK